MRLKHLNLFQNRLGKTKHVMFVSRKMRGGNIFRSLLNIGKRIFPFIKPLVRHISPLIDKGKQWIQSKVRGLINKGADFVGDQVKHIPIVGGIGSKLIKEGGEQLGNLTDKAIDEGRSFIKSQTGAGYRTMPYTPHVGRGNKNSIASSRRSILSKLRRL